MPIEGSPIALRPRGHRRHRPRHTRKQQHSAARPTPSAPPPPQTPRGAASQIGPTKISIFDLVVDHLRWPRRRLTRRSVARSPLTMAAIGTKQTSRHVRSNAANGVEADIIGSLRAFPLLTQSGHCPKLRGELLGCRTLAKEKMVNRVGGHECGVTLWQV
jgi:hypothetical protein